MKFLSKRRIVEELRRIEYLDRLHKFQTQIKPGHIFWTVFSFAMSFLIAVRLWSSSIPSEAILMLSIFVLASLLWITEALPLFATAFVIISLEIILISNPGDWVHLGMSTGEDPNYRLFLHPLADPVIILFLGGFLLAQASVKVGIDKALASNILKIFGSKPKTVMLGLMVITCLFSMWMSNTATTAMMITLTVPLFTQIPVGDPFRKALVLCIPFAANIGGLGTPIASPPNAVALGFLKNVGLEMTFLEWIMVASPLMVIMLFIAWQLLWVFYKPNDHSIQVVSDSQKITGKGYYVMVIFGITIILWLTDTFHGLPTAVVALVPILGFTTTNIIRRSDINSLEWHILILIAGGIALGLGMKTTGLDAIIIEYIPQNGAIIFPVLIVITVVLSTFMSNTAASNLLIPLGVSFATGIHDKNLALELGIGIALAASMSMALPISTPPNAIAYSRGILTSRDFLKCGISIGVLAIMLILFGRIMVRLIGY